MSFPNALSNLPAGLQNARQFAFVGHFAQTQTAQAKEAIKPFRATAQITAVVQANFGELAFGGKHTTLVFFIDCRGLSQGSVLL
jgi:hypothetical protein